MTLQFEISNDCVRICFEDGIEIVGWSVDEWTEDPEFVVPAIANAIHLAHTAPNYLIELNKEHINSQRS